MRMLWNIFNKFIIIALAIAFVRWYVKGHFGKYFILFWLNTILAIVINLYNKSNETPYDHRTGAEIWEQQYGK